MKKTFLFLVVFATIISCSDDKESNTPPQVANNDLIGTWKITEVSSENAEISGTYVTAMGDLPVNSGVTVTGKEYNMTISFADNPKKISNAGSFIAVIKVKTPLLGDQSHEQVISEVPATTGNWSVKNNVLTATNNGVSTSIDIVSYNQSEIIFSYPLSNSLTEDELANLGLKNIATKGNLVVTATKL